MVKLGVALMRTLQLVFCLLTASAAGFAQAPIPQLTPAQTAEAARLFDQIRRDPRGPYGPIRWYCKDGRVLPPKGVPCGTGQGYQHASPSAAAQRLAKLNFDVARFLAGMSFEEYFDETRNHFWLREMVLHEFLSGRTGGWIWGKTYARRGVRQAEDEERAGRRLLGRLLANPKWVERNYLLALLATEATPHGVETSNIRKIRSLSAALAEKNPQFQPIRGKIHSKPESSDIGRVERFLRERKPADTSGFDELLALMRSEYARPRAPAGWSFAKGAARSLEIRRKLSGPGLTGAQAIALADEQMQLQDLAFRAGSESVRGQTRRELLAEMRDWIRYAVGDGLVSFRELDAIEQELDSVSNRAEVSGKEYNDAIQYAERSLEGIRAAVFREFNEVAEHYTGVEPLARELTDDVIRRSVALPLSDRFEVLVRDADAAVGRRHRVLGVTGSRGIRALNPGVAVAPLGIIENSAGEREIRPDWIYVIPATAVNLKPVKGILTLDSGNALSHAQLLAANLGIPNASLPSTLLPELRKLEGKRVFYAVTPDETVVLLPWSSLSPAEQQHWTKTTSTRERIRLNTAEVDLNDRAIRTLEQTRATDSGVRCGPKAANLGRLKRYFPERVSPGLVIPFGIYYAHVSRPGAGGESLFDRVRTAYAEAERMRSSGASAEAVMNFMRPRLGGFRQSIRTMKLEGWFVKEVTRRMRGLFGKDGSYGVFVRSDTNAEDLPEFSGAGLNLTLPNVVGTENILQAIKDVWASPFEERAYEWRAEALVSSAEVYPSVVLARTVGSERSGVIATANLRTLDLSEITVNANEGIAAVVDGGVSESLLLLPDGEVRLLAQARAPYRKVTRPEGGLTYVPTTGSDYVLSEHDIAEIRRLVSEVKQKIPPAKDETGAVLPWDIEFGFVGEKLYLFQIRPLVRYRETKVLEALAAMEGKRPAAHSVRLDEPPESE